MLGELQDTTTAAVVGNSSYNEMLARLTTADLEPAQPQPSAQPGTAREGAEAATAAAGSATRTAETTAVRTGLTLTITLTPAPMWSVQLYPCRNPHRYDTICRRVGNCPLHHCADPQS